MIITGISYFSLLQKSNSYAIIINYVLKNWLILIENWSLLVKNLESNNMVDWLTLSFLD